MAELFDEPSVPSGSFLFWVHEHVFYPIGAEKNQNGIYVSIWACERCPDLFIGGLVGPIPDGFCHVCHWVQQKKWPRKRCEECKTSFDG